VLVAFQVEDLVSTFLQTPQFLDGGGQLAAKGRRAVGRERGGQCLLLCREVVVLQKGSR
jgi:hypothetical protein